MTGVCSTSSSRLAQGRFNALRVQPNPSTPLPQPVVSWVGMSQSYLFHAVCWLLTGLGRRQQHPDSTRAFLRVWRRPQQSAALHLWYKSLSAQLSRHKRCHMRLSQLQQQCRHSRLCPSSSRQVHARCRTAHTVARLAGSALFNLTLPMLMLFHH